MSEFKSKITIETPVLTPTDTGGSIRTWDFVAKPWAKIEEKNADERLIAQRIDAANVFVIVIRFIPGISEKMRILHRGLVLQIKSVILIDGLTDFLQIKAVQEGDGT